MEANISEHTERLWEDDGNAKDRILSIDLNAYDDLVTYPGGVDWPCERKKILFLQTALRLGFPWNDVARFTAPHFGQTLHSPFVPIVEPIFPRPFTLPAFDIARQTVGQWVEAAETAWKAYRAYVACGLREFRQQAIKSGRLNEFERPRCSTGVKGQKKAPILDERAAYYWAVVYFFATQFGKPLTWAELADQELQIRRFKGSAPARAKLKRRLAEQVRTNVTAVLRALKLPDGTENDASHRVDL